MFLTCEIVTSFWFFLFSNMKWTTKTYFGSTLIQFNQLSL